MSDLISRQKAIDALGEKPVGETDWDLGCINQWEWDTEILRTLPSAEPERKKGKWIEISWSEPNPNLCCTSYAIQSAKCSICGKYHTTPYLHNLVYFPFCPNCGAKLDWSE